MKYKRKKHKTDNWDLKNVENANSCDTTKIS